MPAKRRAKSRKNKSKDTLREVFTALFLAQFFKSVQEKGLFALICFKYFKKTIVKKNIIVTFADVFI